MALTPVVKRLVPHDVYDQLLEEVLGGSLGVGDALPSERRLAELLGVSRPAVREALQRLAASRLVEVRQGGSTTVRDFQQHAGLELLPRLLVRHGELDPVVARSIVEARLAIAPGMVALACRRAPHADEQARAELRAAVGVIAAAADPLARQVAALAYWDRIVGLADSIVFTLLFNNLRQAYEPAMEALAPLLDLEVSRVEDYREIADAVLAGHVERATAAVDSLLGPTTEAIVTFLEQLDDELDDEGDNR